MGTMACQGGFGQPGGCFDLQTSPAHCGMCGTSCGDGTCAAGACACAAPLAMCPGFGMGGGMVCTNLQTNRFNCGTCGHFCPPMNGMMGTCVGGMCQ
jgi:hypothetical protein